MLSPTIYIVQIYLFDTIYGWEFERFCVNLKKIVEIVEKLLYNEDKLNEKYRKQ